MRNFVKTKFPFLIPILYPIYNKMNEKRFKNSTLEKIFTEIYEKNMWTDKESRSGTGSSLKKTKSLRKVLPELFKDYSINSILDIPCGDFNWMREVNLKSISYIGADIVEEINQNNIKKYLAENKKFVKMDILKDNLPKVDLIFCRDLFIHFSYEDIFKAVAYIKKSGSKFLLTTSFMAEKKNRNCSTGGWHPINLLIKPFSFPNPLKIIDEEDDEVDVKRRSLLLWNIGDL